MRRHLLVVASALLIVVAIAFIALGGAMIADGPWPCSSNLPLLALSIILFGASLGAVTVRNFGWRLRPAESVPEIASSGPKIFAAVIAVILGIIGSSTSALSLWVWNGGGMAVLGLFVSVPFAAACAILCALLSRAARVPPKAPRPAPPRLPHAHVLRRR